MENFFIEDKFYSDLSDFADEYSEEEIEEMSDDTEWTAEGSDLEPIFQLDVNSVFEFLYDIYGDRFPEDSDKFDEKIKTAIRGSIDFAVLNESLPKLCYPNGKFFKITKADLIWLLNQ